MKLKDALYRISRKTVNTADGKPLEYEIVLDERHFIYQAHFPGEPVTPGVCIIQIAEELLEDHLQRDFEIRQVKNVKFLSVVSPTSTPCVTYTFSRLTVSEESGECKAQILVTAQEETLRQALRQAQGPSLAKLSIVLKVKREE